MNRTSSFPIIYCIIKFQLCSTLVRSLPSKQQVNALKSWLLKGLSTFHRNYVLYTKLWKWELCTCERVLWNIWCFIMRKAKYLKCLRFWCTQHTALIYIKGDDLFVLMLLLAVVAVVVMMMMVVLVVSVGVNWWLW